MARYPKKRELCGVYFRVERDGKWQNVCFSDMTHEEREALSDRDSRPAEEQVVWWRNLANIMADTLHEVGDEFGIYAGGIDD